MANDFTFDPEEDGREDQYRYGRKYRVGPQEGYVLHAELKTWEDGGQSIQMTIGLSSPETDEAGNPLGVKVDVKSIRRPSPDFARLVRAFHPNIGKGGTVALAEWRNRLVRVNVVEERDRKKSDELGREVKRPVIWPDAVQVVA